MQDSEPLVSINASSENGNLHTLMEGVCELVTFYELVSRTNNGSLLHTLLTANIKDSCQWVSHNFLSRKYIDVHMITFSPSLQLDYIVSNHPDVTGSNDFSDLPTSCSPTNTTRLHHYCLQMKVRGNQLRILTRDTSDALHTYFRGSVPLSNNREWIQTSSIPSEQQTRILSNI